MVNTPREQGKSQGWKKYKFMGAKIGLAMDETVISLTCLVMGHSLALCLLNNNSNNNYWLIID